MVLMLVFIFIFSIDGSSNQFGELVLNGEDFVLVLFGEHLLGVGNVFFLDMELEKNQILDVLVDERVLGVEVRLVV